MVARLDFAVASPQDFEELRRRFRDLPVQPRLLQSREDGIDISSPGRQSFTLLVGEETGGKLYSGDVYLSPGFGAPSHHQPTEDEMWYLVEGELDVRVGSRRTTISAGAFAYIPRNTTHAFRNNTSSNARLLTWNSPGGHERAFEAMRALAARGITEFPRLRETFRHHEIHLHADENQSAEQDEGPGPKIVAGRAEGEDISWSGVDARRLLSGKESRGDFEVLDICLDQGASLAPNGHEASTTCLYVLDGRVELKAGALSGSAGRGAFAFVPRGTRLLVSHAGDAPAHVVLWRTPCSMK